MSTDQEIDLGAGVRVVPSPHDTLIVHSDHLDLGLQEPRGRVLGTTVVWQGELYGVTRRANAGDGFFWTLGPWPANEPQRGIFRLDLAAVAKAEQEYRHEQESVRRRRLLAPLLPLVGLVPGRMQRRWWNEWGFPAPLATTLSSVAELLLGVIGLPQGCIVAFGGDYYLPDGLHWLAVVGPLLFAEGLVRLVYLTSHGDPMGSMLGSPLLLFDKKAAKPALELRSPAPVVSRFDPQAGVLELWSTELRPDWDEPGSLPYRGQRFALEGQHKEGHGWRYCFVLTTDSPPDHAPSLRLLPPARRDQEPTRAGLEVSFGRMILVTTLVCLAPRIYQERWSRRIGSSPLMLTVLGSVAELIGGVSQVRADLRGGSPMLLLDLFLIGEAVVRLGVVVVSRQAAGSLLGWPFTRLWESLTR